VKLFVVSE